MTEQQNEKNNFYVYEHIRNDTGVVFYVGKGKNKRATSKTGRNIFWKRIVVKSDGFSARYVEENMSEHDAFVLEKIHIAKLKNSGIVLCNLTDGGEGPSGIIPTHEHKRKISQAKTGIKRPKELMDMIAEKKTIKMIGKKFGRLTVIDFSGEKIPARHRNYVCKCDCGKEIIKSAPALRHGREPSCGCAAHDFQTKKHNKIGQKFGLLTVMFSTGSNSKRNLIWMCKCECGEEKLVSSGNLASGHTSSCGCIRKKLQTKNVR